MGAWEDGFAAGYRAGLRDAERIVSTGERYGAVRGAARPASKPKRTRAPSAYNKRLGRALKRLNKRARLKSGKYRKGWNAKKVMRLAHKEAKK